MADTLDRIHPSLRSLAIPIDELHEDPRNANLHDARGLSALAADFLEFGQRKNVVVRREGMIMEAGNGTLAALRDAGWTHLAGIICDDDEQRAAAYAIADNQTARLSAWDPDQLRDNLAAAMDEYGDVFGEMWTGDELAEILAGKAAELADALEAEGDASTDPSNMVYAVVVEFDDEHGQASLLEELEHRGMRCRLMMC